MSGSSRPRDFGFGSLFARLVDAVLVVDASTRCVVLWNTAAAALFGFPERIQRSPTLSALMALDLDAALEAGAVRDPATRQPGGTAPCLEVVAHPRDGRELHLEVTISTLDDTPAGPGYLLLVARDVTERIRATVRQAAAVRVARKMAAESSPLGILDNLLEEAEAAVGADGATVYRWDEGEQRLAVVRHTVATPRDYVPSGQGAVGKAVLHRAPVILNDYQSDPGRVEAALRAGVKAALAVPLLHEGQLLGALGVVTYRPDKQFRQEDGELLELLAGIAAAVIVSIERARLEGTLLAARTTAHELGNSLAALVGHVQMLQRGATHTPSLARRADTATRLALEVASKMRQLQELKELDEQRWGALGSTLRLPS